VNGREKEKNAVAKGHSSRQRKHCNWEKGMITQQNGWRKLVKKTWWATEKRVGRGLTLENVWFTAGAAGHPNQRKAKGQGQGKKGMGWRGPQ